MYNCFLVCITWIDDDDDEEEEDEEGKEGDGNEVRSISWRWKIERW